MYKSFIFFSLDDQVLFHRDDAERAEWTHQEMSLQCVFPYDAEKEIHRGMRIGFEDSFGKFQLFEIRIVKDSEPDHTQDITAEHIVISELTDRHLISYKPSDVVTAQTAVNALLTGTGWSIGTCSSTASHKPDLEMTSVWDALTEVRDMMGLRLEPYVTVSSTAITGRYIDVVDNEGTWRGVRLSVNKNIEQVGVTYDDTNLITAVYGYGKGLDHEYTPPDNPYDTGNSGSHSRSGDSSTDYGAAYVTIKNVVWTQTSDHPAKPAGQMYLEDPEATALYGRNGQPRFGFYSNSNVSDDDELCELCWEALQRQTKPAVTIDCTCGMMRSLGYAGEQIQIGDTVRVEIEPIGAVLELMCICLTEDLLDPENTRPTIGKYIKDIVYITKEESRAGGGGGGGGGGANQDQIQQEKNVYTVFDRTDEYILMQAVSIQSIEGALNTAFSEIYMNAQQISLEVTRATGAEQTLSGRITVNADNIALEITNRENAVSAINLTLQGIYITGNDVYIGAGHISLDGYATLTAFEAEVGRVDNLISGATTAAMLSTTLLQVGGTQYKNVPVSLGPISAGGFLGTANASVDLDHYHSITCSESGGLVTITLGAAQTTAGTDSFNIAGTQFYQSGVLVSASWSGATYTATSGGGGSASTTVSLSYGNWSGGSMAVNVMADNSARATGSVSIPSTVTFSGAEVSQGLFSITCALGDTTRTGTCNINASLSYAAGAAGVTLSDAWGSSGDYQTSYTVTASNSETKSQSLYVTSGSWSSGSCPIYLRSGSSSGTIRARSSVSMPSVGEATWSWSYPQQGYIQASVTIGGKTYSDAKQY